MSKIRRISIVFFLVVFAYSVLTYYASFFQHSVKYSPCNIPIIKLFVSWDSACFYRALFDGKAHITDVKYEQIRLDKFDARNGMNQRVLWYRMHFSREFRNYLPYTDQDIDHAYWRYQMVAPHKTEELATYLNYLINNKQKARAQETLDKFCGLYIKHDNFGIVVMQSVNVSLKKHDIDLEARHCIGLLREKDQPDWFKEEQKLKKP